MSAFGATSPSARVSPKVSIPPFSATQPSRWEWPSCPVWKACSRAAHGTTAQHRRRWSRRFDMEDREIRAALDRHWAGSDANDFEAEHQIYREDALPEYPQSRDR